MSAPIRALPVAPAHSRVALIGVIAAHAAIVLAVAETLDTERPTPPRPISVALLPAPVATPVDAPPQPLPPAPVRATPSPVVPRPPPAPVPDVPEPERPIEPARIVEHTPPAPPPPPQREVDVPQPTPIAAPSAIDMPRDAPPPSPPQVLAAVPPPAPPAPPPAAPVPAASESPVTAPQFDAAYLRNPIPAYPTLSRHRGEEGLVLLRVFVTMRGDPVTVDVKTSCGFPRLDRAAREAVQRWKFSPARRGEQAVDAWVVVPIRFSLRGNS